MSSGRLMSGAKALTMALILGWACQASAFNVTSSITGWWEQPDQQSHGLIISTSQLPDGTQRGVVFWAHYDAEGNATWLLGEGPLGGSAINADLYEVGGVAFMQSAGSVPSPEQKIGELVITFSDCNTGEASYETTTIGAGSFRVSRLTKLAGLQCSGGVTDDIPPSVPSQKIEADLIPVGGFESIDADAEWVLTPGLAKFEVEVENAQTGEYTLMVGGIERGTFDVQIDGSDSAAEGSIEFFSPQRGFHDLLDFDPRGELVQVISGGVTIASVTFPTESTVIGLDPDDDGDGVDDDDSGAQIVLEQRMTNAGVYPNGKAELEFETQGMEKEFDIDVDNIPVGDYSVVVDTVSKGTLTVAEKRNGKTEGELEFRSPAKAGYALLDFDPQGALIEIIDGTTTVFFATFQGTGGNGTGDDDDSGGGDGGDDDSGGGDDGDGGDDDSGGGSDDDGDGGNDDDDNEGSKEIVRYRLDNLTGDPKASATAKLETDNEGVEFEVEVDRVSPGTYTVTVGGTVRGEIVVDQDDNDGDIEFSDPQEEDSELLDFEVAGQTIEILDGETVLFTGTFPGN